MARVEPKREDVVFLDVSDRSDELHVGTQRVMHKVRTPRCREAKRVNFASLNAVSARLWDGPESAKDVRVVLLDESSLVVMAEAEAMGKARGSNGRH